MIVAIDGPSGAGKSTVAKELSKILKFEYIDTGAMYRAIAYKLLNYDGELSEENTKTIFKNTMIDYIDNNVYLDGKNVESLIRTNEVSMMASKISKLDYIREKLVYLQREIGDSKDIILDGRDVTTVVFPNADFKFFVTAKPETRAKRRYDELLLKGENVTYEDILEDINKRDHSDTTREISPLKIAEDAIVIDTSDFSLEEVLNKLLMIIKGEK